MPHNAVHKDIQRLDKVRSDLDGEVALKQGSSIIKAAVSGDSAEAARLILEQLLAFDTKHADGRGKAANIGMDLAEELVKHA